MPARWQYFSYTTLFRSVSLKSFPNYSTQLPINSLLHQHEEADRAHLVVKLVELDLARLELLKGPVFAARGDGDVEIVRGQTVRFLVLGDAEPASPFQLVRTPSLHFGDWAYRGEPTTTPPGACRTVSARAEDVMGKGSGPMSKMTALILPI